MGIEEHTKILWKNVTGGKEQLGIGGEWYTVPLGKKEDAGTYTSNNGTLAFVCKTTLEYYCGPRTDESVSILQREGYCHGNFYVPHSNDSGAWLHRSFREQ